MMEKQQVAEKSNDSVYKRCLVEGEFIRYYDVSGCYVLLPNSMHIWEYIKGWLDTRFKKLGVDSCYFPLLQRPESLYKEKEHIEGFCPEVAWVTCTGDIKGDSKKLSTPLCIRPTSETVIYPVMSEMLQSYSQLPIRLNQWCNIVRWEFKDPTPFIRSREFLWQEGHTLFRTREEAVEETDQILALYQKAFKELGVFVVAGRKTESEKFPGAEFTLSVEAFISPVKRAVQCATVHHLGQSFSKVFDTGYEDEKQKRQLVYQNSWGFTTRSLGVSFMQHMDEHGFRPPFKAAKTQIVIIPVVFKKKVEQVIERSEEVLKMLKRQTSLRVVLDASNDHNCGWKFNHWEMRGVPVRIEIGPKDIENGVVTVARRDTKTKTKQRVDNGSLLQFLAKIEYEYSDTLYEQSEKAFYEDLLIPQSFDQIDSERVNLLLWCESEKCEEKIKQTYHAKALCCPLKGSISVKQNDIPENCVVCNGPGKRVCLFARSY